MVEASSATKLLSVVTCAPNFFHASKFFVYGLETITPEYEVRPLKNKIITTINLNQFDVYINYKNCMIVKNHCSNLTKKKT